MNEEDFRIEVTEKLERIANALEKIATCTFNDQIAIAKVE